jgi:hypothetical protein
MEPQDFFDELLEKTKEVFNKSPISKKQEKGWGASVCDTTIKKGKPILAGINWGGDDNYFFQTEYPKDDKPRDYVFLKKDPLLLSDHIVIEKINYCNVCFFRTPKESYLVDEDWENSIPLFEEYVQYISPNYIIVLGKLPIHKLWKYSNLEEYKEESLGVKPMPRVYTAKLFGKYDLYGLPHPNAHISSENLVELRKYVKGIFIK